MKIRNQSQPKIPRRMTAFLLFFSMLLPIFTVFPSYAVDEVAEPIGENTAAELAPIETEDQVLARLTANSQVLNYVDETAFRAAGHVNRLPEEEDLNSYVFENEDGTRTAYILAEPVKYIDNTGTVQEKNLSLSSSSIVANAALAQPVDTSAYTVTATDTPMTFPTDLSQGVRFNYRRYTLTLRPENLRENVSILQADGKIIYQNAFGSTAHLMYTPTNTGLKEDILLVREGNVNTFSFILNTDGLIPAEDAGGWYLWDGIDISRQIRLGQVISYDANGDFSIGEITITHNGGTTYRITLTVDPAFLESAIYPVTVDPTFTVSDNVTGANAIEDIVLFEGAPDACYRSMQYNTVGASSLGTGKTAFRLKGFQNSAAYASAFEFTNVKFRVYDYSSVAQEIGLYPLANASWQENTATWNNIGMCYEPYQCFANIPIGSWAEFDITTLANQWLNLDFDINGGFILISKNNAVAKKIYSSENTANTARRPYVEATYIYDPVFIYDEAMYKNESQTINLYITSHVNAVTWSVSDSSVISITSSGTMTTLATATVYANKLGSAEITATLTLSDGTTASITKTIYVVLENGVYTIGNSYATPHATEGTFYLSATSSTELSNITVRTDHRNSPDNLLHYWWINYMGNGEYEIYSMADTSKALITYSVENEDFSDEYYPKLASIASTETACARWYIKGSCLVPKVEIELGADTTDTLLRLQYSFLRYGSNYLYYDLDYAAEDNMSFERWTFTKEDLVGMAFRDAAGKLIIKNSFTVPITDYDSFSFSLLGYTAEIYGIDPLYLPTIQWYSSNLDVAYIDEDSGEIIPLAPGRTLITARATVNGVEYCMVITLDIHGLTYGAYFLQNQNYSNFLKLNDAAVTMGDPTEPLAISSITWTATQQSAGYGTVRIGDQYLSVNNETVSTVAVSSLAASIPDNLLFKFVPLSNGNYVIIPKTAEDENLLLVPLANGTGVAVSDYSSGDSVAQWNIVKNSSSAQTLYSVTVDVKYDNGYNRQFASATNRIESLLRETQNYYLSSFGINFTFLFDGKDSMFTSYSDTKCTKRNCTDDDSHHADINKICDSLNKNASADFPIAFIGHSLCYIRSDGEHANLNGVRSGTENCCLIKNRTEFQSELRTLIHEIGHVFKAKDHYYSKEVATKDPDDNLHSTDTLKKMYPDLTFSSDCLYGENRNTSIVKNNMTMCSGCKHFIKEHAGMFN